MKTLLQLSLICALILTTSSISGQTAVWTGNGNETDWDDAQNWEFTNGGSLSNAATVYMITSKTPIGPSHHSTPSLHMKQLIIESGVTVINPMDFALHIDGSRLNGLDNFGIFNNNGAININNTGNEGLSVRCIGSFINNGTINVGQGKGKIGNDGLVTSGTFTNNAVINIDNVNGNGLKNNNLTTEFKNLGEINIGQNSGNIQHFGWLIEGDFDNEYGIIAIDSMNSEGIFAQAKSYAINSK